MDKKEDIVDSVEENFKHLKSACKSSNIYKKGFFSQDAISSIEKILVNLNKRIVNIENFLSEIK
ncbi:MAG: hypothetical protein Satyrvirus29_8 [Satyrvirus sp.]|uniref:Uncharacterized protein n=1 Tax=Satyrvirus sp. TaxID=2487771 RepID=A0A3G5AER6_9VIRU|nr:MAG: hypothetical protein Satyrvirus29_8 [Satyrvirus sp.]